ncbi:ankyrin repeat domain-containing protein 26-like [Psammomys obesus]|uniref:ankyrin repeat domain-containing protein 26-like n=1 Tax=Psammomys obesus TaxID=48139 RepID=UPI002452E285|nr:ankyrin repeat domain-containing protein 26-like [Psammomys obesus]
MKKIFKGHSPWGFLGFRHSESQDPPRYLTGYTPVKKIHKAASMGDIIQVQRMLEFGDVNVNVTDRKKRTALHYACAHGQSEMASLLLWYDCNIEARDRDESTALIKATQRQHEECVRILLEKGADPNTVDAYQNAALHYAVYNNNPSIAAKLLAFSANIEVKTKNGYTPLILAVLENKQEMVRLLVQSAADVNAQDNCRRSALIHAVRTQSKNMISFLLQQGADASLVDACGATAQSYSVFETVHLPSQDLGGSCPEPTAKEDRHSFDAKDGCIACSHPFKKNGQRVAELPAEEEENLGGVDQLESFTHKPSNPESTVEDEETKPPVVQSSLLTESNLWIGYPADWPEPIKFSRQPAVYNPVEWREDMEAQSIPLEEDKQQGAVLSGKEANVQTPEQQLRYRISDKPGSNVLDPPAKENSKDEVVSLLAPLEEEKAQMKEFSVTEAAELHTDAKLERQGVLEYEEKGLEICQDSNLEAAESTESYSVVRFSTKPDLGDPEPTTRKDEYNFDTKDKDSFEKHPPASRSPEPPAKQSSPPPLPLQEGSPEPEKSPTSDEEDASGHSRSAKGQVLATVPLEGEELEFKETVQLVLKKPTQEAGETCEGVKTNVHHEEEPPRDDATGRTRLKPVSPKVACEMLDCGDGDVSAALASGALWTFPRQKDGGLGNAVPSPPPSQIVEYGGQSITKFPLMKNKFDGENTTSEWEEPLHKSKRKSSKNAESRRVRGRCPEGGVGEQQEGPELKSPVQRAAKASRADGPWEPAPPRKPGRARAPADARERNHGGDARGWADSVLLAGDSHKKSKGARDLSLRPLARHCGSRGAVAPARAAPPAGRTASAFQDGALRDELSDHEFRILEEEILAWEKVHLENESVSESLLNKGEGILSDARDQQQQYPEMGQAGEVNSEVTSQPEQESPDSSEDSQLPDTVLLEFCPQTQNTPEKPATTVQPLSEKESKQIGAPPGHLEEMSEDPEVNEKWDGEPAPGHANVPSMNTPEKDRLGNNGEPSERSLELQRTARDVFKNICPSEEPLPGNYRARTQLKVEEIRRTWPSLESEVSENLCLDNSLIFKRKGGRTGKPLPTEEKDELARNVPDTCEKEAKKSERETWMLREPVTTPVFEKFPPEAAGLLRVKGGPHLTELDQAERRLTTKQAKEKQETETQVNEMEDANCGSQPSVTASGSGSSSLWKLWDMTHSYERLIELKNSHYELLTKKLEKMENKAGGVQREQTEIKKIKSWLQHKEMEWEELCTWRFPLKQDEKQENAEFLFQQKKMQLKREKEQYGETVDWTQHPGIRTMVGEVKAIENDLRQLQGAQGQLAQSPQKTQASLQASLQRLEVRLSKLKITLKEQSAKIEQIQNELLRDDLLGDETKKLIQQTQSLECSLEKEMNKNEELMIELTGFKKFFEETKKKLNKHESRELSGPGDLKTSQFDMHIPINTLRHEFHNLKENWDTTYYKYLHMVVKLQFIEQELIAIKTEQKKCGRLLKNQESLEEEVLHFRRWMREKATQARDQNNIESLRDTNDATALRQMDLRIRSLESQLATRGSQHRLHRGLLEDSQHCAEEQSVTQPLKTELGQQAQRSPRK